MSPSRQYSPGMACCVWQAKEGWSCDIELKDTDTAISKAIEDLRLVELFVIL